LSVFDHTLNIVSYFIRYIYTVRERDWLTARHVICRMKTVMENVVLQDAISVYIH